ncbi:hypothetical protein GF325_05415 [Candidatus Bathyarchaeota archaeon]|nr:hypothetical protein [Candidatus Bathyarchaeota archaeon]
MLAYAPIDEGSESIIVAYGIVAIFSIFMTGIMLKKWLAKRSEAPKFLFLTFLSYAICITVTMIGFVEVLLTREKRELYQFSLAFSFAGLMISNVFLLLFANEIFSIGRKSRVPLLVANVVVAIFLTLPWNYYGILKEDYEGASIRPYTSGAMVLLSTITYLHIMVESLRVSRKVDELVGKAGFRLIAGSQVCLIMFFLLMVADMIYFGISEELTGYTVFNHAAWFAAASFFALAYLGFVMPPWLRGFIEKHD